MKSNIVTDFAQMRFEARFEHFEEYEKLLNLVERLKKHAKQSGVVAEVSDVREKEPMVPDDRTLAYVQGWKSLRKLMDFRSNLKSAAAYLTSTVFPFAELKYTEKKDRI